MPRIIVLLASALALAALPAAAAPLAAYGKLPSVEQVEISPDGLRLAVVVTDGEQRSVVIETVADQKTEAVIQAGDKKLRDVRWAGPDHLLLTTSAFTIVGHDTTTKAEWWQLKDYNLKTRTLRGLLADGSAGMNVVFDTPMVRILDGKPYAFVVSVDGFGWSALYRIDLETDHAIRYEEAIRYTDEWLVDSAGRVAARTLFEPDAHRWSLQVKRPDGWRTVKTVPAAIEHPELRGFASDGRSILITGLEDDQLQLRQFDPSAPDWGPPKPAEGLDLIYDPQDALIGTTQEDGDDVTYAFTAPSDQAAWTSATKAFPGERVRLDSMSADHRKLVVLADSPTLGPAYAIVDLDAKTAHWISPVYDGLTADDISPVRPVAFKAADGLDLTGYLTLPRGKTPANLPLVVLPHGGPAARDRPGFDWWAQAMASRGYAVLQVNYRGSAGLGWKFLSAGFGEWGRKMQTDLSDGVRYLAGQGIIDPKRVCIVGASYGGYAALAGATLDTGVYRCAVSVGGLSDLRKLVIWAGGDNVTVERYWDRFMGVHDAYDLRLPSISPINHVDKVTIPILLIHGRDDTVAPFEQSQTMADALKRAGKPYDFVTLEHEDHWLSRGDTRLQMLQATIDFLQKNNPPG